ncbi:8-oxo-dGTP diphosphatase [Bacillaceae bacterium CLA-AA-H227]|uniref:8-oxo-dGTP diphosphatase n=1 Tax=Robertmurraya yapensis (ex Hitch et al 2024) TaxID=3133160 RepID=A0ACC6S8D3_9BACI
MYKQTLCFIRRNDELLVLNREYAPTQGLWNGVGGKMENEETPLECVIREVKEETDIDISSYQIRDKGIISWEVDNSFSGGMYVFLVDIVGDYVYPTPKKTEEGILDWKKISWLLAEKNYGVGEMIPQYLPITLNDDKKYHHHCVIKNAKLTGYEYKEL